jgi:hypothetical protein
MIQGATLKPLTALNGVSEHDPVNKVVCSSDKEITRVGGKFTKNGEFHQ